MEDGRSKSESDFERPSSDFRDPIGQAGGVNVYGYVGGDPVNGIDLSGFGPYLPQPDRRPPGWNNGWETGTDKRGDYSKSPNSEEKWYPHTEDKGHWGHYDSDKGPRYPGNSKKPWPGQKKKLKEDQSDKDPWPKTCTRSGWQIAGDAIKSIPPEPVKKAGIWAVVAYVVISEGTRIFPLRNLAPIP